MNEEVLPIVGDKQLKERRKRWNSIYKKYERRGENNNEDCSLSDVSYKFFMTSLKIKPKLRKVKKQGKIQNRTAIGTRDNFDEVHISEDTITSTNSFINVDASSFIDEDSNDIFTSCESDCQTTSKDIDNVYATESVDSGVEMSDKVEDVSEPDAPADANGTVTENNSNSNGSLGEIHSIEDNHMHELICFIEKELNSNLKELVKNRSVSKLLDSEDYSYWHKCTKQELTRLEKYISRNDLKEYMTYCYNANIPDCMSVEIIQDVIVGKMNSNIKALFLKREFTKHDKNKYLHYSKMIFLEWQRLCEVMPLDYLLFYGTSLVSSIKKLKKGTSLSDKELN